jgi:hypothetical protein
MAKIFHPLLALIASGTDRELAVEPRVREHLPPIRDVPEEVIKLDRDQIVVRSYVGGLVKSFERRAA